MSRPAVLPVTDGPEVLHATWSVSRETLDRLTIYVNLLLRWQSAQNLVAPSTLGEVWRRHVADSFQVSDCAPDARVWADFGSGAGFPGLVTAIRLMERGGGHVHLVESNQRKAAFLRTVIRETGCPATVHAERIETVTARLLDTPPGDDGPVTAVSARALADLKQLCAYAAPFSATGALCIFHKGRNFRDEVAQASHQWDFDLVEKESLIDPDSRILVLGRIRPRRVAGKG
ncbi:MAG: 16S rRNA (guanine(527)-N(7))-methyltransferase RsmG [Stappia sp.]|uniref:16S rRNA (guanine(527)-N(7))-methyltransferase RsmG n=1 Tax=Stappia sp. TaxID=1870903 RepID=UPI000C57AED2|nr:16S rRNA (guanine(527)-N(7))-methyltransferase RsmG [Stappia sp.]MAA99001.1 16S rRNA (guanine(527)-N(7))-methyltransferase RsmG [Stappia sp.]MBM18419.1 16S rRNA (guanine(527)-N(7))-methyltransferase RsmG [Stappia sp.]|tara:strand:- start:923 stop:1615 length:693 start_codon:yes stop_codon:yes gene_type:complete